MAKTNHVIILPGNNVRSKNSYRMISIFIRHFKSRKMTKLAKVLMILQFLPIRGCSQAHSAQKRESMLLQYFVAQLPFHFWSDIYNVRLALQAYVCYYSPSAFTQSAVQSAQKLIPRGKVAGARSWSFTNIWCDTKEYDKRHLRISIRLCRTVLRQNWFRASC